MTVVPSASPRYCGVRSSMLVTMVVRPRPVARITAPSAGEVEDGRHRAVRIHHRAEVAVAGPDLEPSCGELLGDQRGQARGMAVLDSPSATSTGQVTAGSRSQSPFTTPIV